MNYQSLDPTPGAMVVDIPFPYKQFTDTAFFLTETSSGKSLFIPDDQYQRIDPNRIQIANYKDLGLNEDSELRFTFIHQKNRRWIGKLEYHFTPESAGQREFQLPSSPYSGILNLSKRTFVFYNRVRQTPGLHYKLENTTGKIVMLNKSFKGQLTDRVDVMVIYTGSADNKAIQELPESGYIYLSNKEIDRNYSPDRMAVFVNGKLVDRDDIIRISNGVYKISKDIGSRYDLDVRNLSPRVNSLVPFYQRTFKNTDQPWQMAVSDFPSRIDVPAKEPYHRKQFKPEFNPIYFDPELIEQPNLWINLIHTKRTHKSRDTYNLRYDLNLYGSDYVDYPSDLFVVLQLRLRGERSFDENSLTPVLIGRFHGALRDRDDDFLIASTQVKTVLECDTYRYTYGIDGIIGRIQGDPREFEEGGPLYYTLSANRFEYDNLVGIFEWTITSEPNNQGVTYWRQHIGLIPDNKQQILDMKGDVVVGWTSTYDR